MKSLRLMFLSVCMLLLIGAEAYADDCYKAFDRDDYIKAYPLCISLARQGDLSAQFKTAWMYASGQGVKVDKEKAAFWYKKAVKQGDLSAMNNLGVLYREGDGIARDYSKALFWFRKAAEKGHVFGTKNYGYMFIMELGVNLEQADALAKFAIGYVYAESFLYIARDEEKVILWYQKAAELNNATAANNLAYLYKRRGEYKLAAKWFKKGVELGEESAMHGLGVLYALGVGVPRDRGKAFDLYLRSARAGAGIGAADVADSYRYSMGYYGEDFLEKAEEWYKKAIKLGYSDAKNDLVTMKGEENSARLFGQNLAHVKRKEMRDALKGAGIVALREDSGYYYDKYDPSSVLDGATKLLVGYVSDSGRFAEVEYTFDSSKNVENISEMMRSKYGVPDSIDGQLRVGEMTYKWKKGAIDIEVTRSWPSSIVRLEFTHERLKEEMEAEIEWNDKKEKQKKFEAQSAAF